MKIIRSSVAVALLAGAQACTGVLAKDVPGPKVNPISDSPLEYYSQGGVVVDGIAYFTSDDGSCVKTGMRSPEFHTVVAFDVRTLKKVRTYHFAQTYDSSPFLFQRKDGTWLIIAHEHEKARTVALERDTGKVAWISAANQPGGVFFGYSIYRRADWTSLLFQASKNGLHAMSGETGRDVWAVAHTNGGGITPAVDQKNGWVFYQGTGKMFKLRAESGEIITTTEIPKPNDTVSFNTVLVNDAHGYFVAARMYDYGKKEWGSAIRVYDRDLKLVWEKTGLPNGKKDTLTYADGRLICGSGNSWGKYTGEDWKYLAAYAIEDGRVLWRRELKDLSYSCVMNVPYYKGHFYAETAGKPSKLLRIRASDGEIVETLTYDIQIGSCAPAIIARGRFLSGCLKQDRVIVTALAEGSTADWPGPFGDPQTNTFASPDDPQAKLVPMREIGRK